MKRTYGRLEYSTDPTRLREKFILSFSHAQPRQLNPGLESACLKKLGWDFGAKPNPYHLCYANHCFGTSNTHKHSGLPLVDDFRRTYARDNPSMLHGIPFKQPRRDKTQTMAFRRCELPCPYYLTNGLGESHFNQTPVKDLTRAVARRSVARNRGPKGCQGYQMSLSVALQVACTEVLHTAPPWPRSYLRSSKPIAVPMHRGQASRAMLSISEEYRSWSRRRQPH
jgi:hypothetical protein